MWCAQFKSAICTFELSQPVMFADSQVCTCELHCTQMAELFYGYSDIIYLYNC